jgi:6,7-dimethyl-8-ribityllumazine synthase
MNQTSLHSPTSSHYITPRGGRIAFIQSCRHKEIVDQCRAAFVVELRRLDPSNLIDFFEVPGAYEIPLQAKLLARTSRYAAIVAAGFVVDGIYRHEFVSDAVISALMRVQLETDVPIISAVLTPQRFHGHEEHKRLFHEHFVMKGTESANACSMSIVDIDAARSLMARPPGNQHPTDSGGLSPACVEQAADLVPLLSLWGAAVMATPPYWSPSHLSADGLEQSAQGLADHPR